jgi:hypothetical protein
VVLAALGRQHVPEAKGVEPGKVCVSALALIPYVMARHFEHVSLQVGAVLAYFDRMSVHIAIPDDLAEQIDHVASDRTAFVTEAVRRLLHDASGLTLDDEVARINQFADELNREAEDVLGYQVIS